MSGARGIHEEQRTSTALTPLQASSFRTAEDVDGVPGDRRQDGRGRLFLCPGTCRPGGQARDETRARGELVENVEICYRNGPPINHRVGDAPDGSLQLKRDLNVVGRGPDPLRVNDLGGPVGEVQRRVQRLEDREGAGARSCPRHRKGEREAAGLEGEDLAVRMVQLQGPDVMHITSITGYPYALPEHDPSTTRAGAGCDVEERSPRPTAVHLNR